ncbi:MAG: L-lactate permease [Persicimonas sp.]
MPTLIDALLAASPIIIVLVLMVLFGRSAAVAGAVGLAASVVVALVKFDLGGEAVPGAGAGLLGAGAEAGFTALTILWIIFGALCLFHLQQRTGALERLREAVGSISDNPRIIAVLIAWFFALFIEGAAGFGTSVALSAPFLVGFGYKPTEAVVITLIGHSVGVSFGAVGTPVLAQAQLVPQAGLELGLAAANFHVLLGWVMLVALLVVVGASRKDKLEDEKTDDEPRIWLWAAWAAVAYLVPMYLIARFVGPELPTLGGALVGSAVFVAGFLAIRGREQAQSDDEMSARTILVAASPYLLVIALVLLTRLVGPITAALSSVEWSWTLWEQFSGSFQPLFHPGTLLVVGFFGGALLQRASGEDVRGAMVDALKKLGPVTLALGAMLALSRVMVHAGMIETLAAWTAAVAGSAWPFFSPWVGVLGTFVTGSATASNILFSEFQLATTTQLAMPELTLLGAQNFGAAVGNIICPHNIVAGGATVGLIGQEAKILKRTLPACAIYATLGGLLALWWVYV